MALSQPLSVLPLTDVEKSILAKKERHNVNMRKLEALG